MPKYSIRLVILCLGLALFLSGCFNYTFDVQHNPDGSGKLTVESILTAEYLNLITGEPEMEDSVDSILARSLITQNNVRDDSNIKSITEEQYTDSSTGALHHILEVEIIDIFTPIYFDQEDEDIPFFEVEKNADGSFLFKSTLYVPSDYTDNPMMEGMPMDQQSLSFFLQGSFLTWQLSIDEFIEGDPQAVFNNTNKVVTWRIPIIDVLFGEEPVEIFTRYQLETIETPEPEPEEVPTSTPAEPTSTPAEPTSIPEEPTLEIFTPTPAVITPDQPDAGLSGLPNWVPSALVGVLCLGGIFMVIAAVVIILIVRKRKQNQPEKPKN